VSDGFAFDDILQRLSAYQRAFLLAYCEIPSITSASEAAGITRTCHYGWMAESEDYRLAFEIAKPIGISSLESEAVRRAHLGCDEPVFYKGVECGSVRKYSDTLMALLLKGHKPDTYKDRSESTVKADLEISKHVDLTKLSDEQFGTLASIVGAATASDSPGDVEAQPPKD
jgi:hypothetical protein